MCRCIIKSILLTDYENEKQQGENYIDCSEIRGRRTKDFNKVCRFDIIDLGPNCVKQQNYGFDDGLPCVLVKINKVMVMLALLKDNVKFEGTFPEQGKFICISWV